MILTPTQTPAFVISNVQRSLVNVKIVVIRTGC